MQFVENHLETSRDAFLISTDPARLALAIIHAFLTHSYWAAGIPPSIVEKSIRHSLCFGIYHHEKQIGFARVITDRATFAHLADGFILEPHRGQGLAVWLMEFIMAHPELQGLRAWSLGTRDAHGLYRKFGFESLPNLDTAMRKYNPDVYLKQA